MMTFSDAMARSPREWSRTLANRRRPRQSRSCAYCVADSSEDRRARLPTMTTTTLPLLYTHVMGSHGFPGWFWTALDKIKAGEYGQTDVRETLDDATQLAIRDQERAGIDVISDGEMRRFFFVQTFYGKMDGLEEI